MLPVDVDFLPLVQLAAMGRRRWAGQAHYVAANSAFYGRLWQGLKPPPEIDDIARLPLTDKAMLRQSQAAAPPFGDYLAAASETVSACTAPRAPPARP